MLCPFCGQDNDKVIDSRSAEQDRVIRRRRQCLACRRRFTTYERVEETGRLMVIKKDGSRVPYDRAKLLAGFQKACFKRPIAAERLVQLVEAIEEEMFRSFEKEIESSDLGRLASEHLKRLDRIAYVRYASVYKQFRDVEDFVAEVREVMDAPPDIKEQGMLFR
jgi:transcriptional repressor NrdR